MKNVIVITGASSGIGKEFAELLDKKISADEIWAIARRKEKLEELGDILKTPVKPVSLDLSDVSNVRIYKDMLEAEEANVKMLVNCSGYGKFNHYENISPEVNQNMIDLNVKAVVAMTDATLPHMGKGRQNNQHRELRGVSAYPLYQYLRGDKSVRFKLYEGFERRT